MDSLFQISMNVSMPMIAMIMHHVPTFMEDIIACVTLGLLGTERIVQILKSVLKTEMIAMQMLPVLIQKGRSNVHAMRDTQETEHTALTLMNAPKAQIIAILTPPALIQMDPSLVPVTRAILEMEHTVLILMNATSLHTTVL